MWHVEIPGDKNRGQVRIVQAGTRIELYRILRAWAAEMGLELDVGTVKAYQLYVDTHGVSQPLY